MSRAPMPLGTWGTISRTQNEPKRWVARCRFRDFDGQTRKVEAWGTSGAAAERALITSLADRAKPSQAILTPETRVSALVDKWLVELDESDLATGTKVRYRALATGHVATGLGGLRIREVSVGGVETFLRSVQDHHGQASARLTRTVLAGMFALAARHDAVGRNIVKDTTAVKSVSKEVRVLDVATIRELRSVLRADAATVRSDVPDVVDALLATGARIGEALAIRWDDVDLLSAVPTVTISGTIVRVPGQGLVRQDHPKSAHGRRRLRIPGFLVEVLMRRQVEQVEPTVSNVVFPSSTGTLRDPYRFRDQWRDARVRAGFEWVTPHTFRKSVASAIDSAADARSAADQLGHSRESVTAKYYIARTHEGPDARAVLDEFAGRPIDGDSGESAGYSVGQAVEAH